MVIGPEFSRIFAEIILQRANRTFLKKMSEDHGLKHRSDFQAFRYVDDYFIFCTSDVDPDTVEKTLGLVLREMKLSINSGKGEKIDKPIITSLTIAKNSIREALSSNIEVETIEFENPSDPTDPFIVYHPKVRAMSLIVEFKSILKRNDVEYKNILNYTFAALERNACSIIDKFTASSAQHRSDKTLIKALLGILEFAFFIYAAEPRVNISVRLARLVSMLVDELHRLGVNRDLKHQVMKYAFDNLTRQLRKSSSKQNPNIEVMYLVLALRKLGREYLLPESILASYFGFIYDDHAKKYVDGQSFDYFAVTVLLSYTTSKKRYSGLRTAAEACILDRLNSRSSYARRDSELVMTYLDLVTCPYVSMATKMKLASAYGQSVFQLWALIACSDYWFTDWHGFDLSLSLDKKRTREVY
ncbi:antiviral reverse transcriptase Drt3b [Thalassococcus sp. S3]|uniref:antiviral reverse transcriptase Drt3b n=1 Tax=Thalassococcus sp. S3 TaxID=2017482 RepID=UPI002739DFBC|nr:antiviral reverse transcriptase Drt3b [Thalassococcus sp. S3]